jgi:DNA processing protein
MEESDQIYQMGLALVPGVGTTLAQKLIEYAGSSAQIFKESPGNLMKIPGIGKKVVDNIFLPWILERARKELDYILSNQISLVFFTDPDYPTQLKNCADAPILLFVKGFLPKQMKHSLSIIGTRSPSKHGKELTISWVKELAASYPDINIISGLAYGIDISAHEAALEANANTIAVLGHGMHTLYPHIHKSTAVRIIQHGALISDFFSHNKREPKNFIRRNRIIAGLTEATLVIESRLKGGAMATAEMANSYNREVFAVPGRPSDPKSTGCNYLIRNNGATLVSSPDDIPFFLGWEKSVKETDKSKSVGTEIFDLTDSQKKILTILSKEELNINELGALLLKHPAQLAGDLLTLEFSGHVKASPGGRFAASTRSC